MIRVAKQTHLKPADVIDVHRNAIERISAETGASRIRAYKEESRFVLIELLGSLLTFYRYRCVRQPGSSDLE